MRILLLEDDDSSREVFLACLSDAGHEVVPCGTLARAMTVLKTSKIDLMVLDLMIGEANSLNLAQFAAYACPAAEIILVTGSGKFAYGEVMSQYPNVNWVLRKPLPLSDLEALVCYIEKRTQPERVVSREFVSIKSDRQDEPLRSAAAG